jgi:hypothetical protein
MSAIDGIDNKENTVWYVEFVRIGRFGVVINLGAASFRSVPL